MQDESTAKPFVPTDTAANRRRPTLSEVACEQCGLIFVQRRPGQQFCSRGCYQQWWIVHRQREYAAKGTQRLVELTANGSPAGKRISEKIAQSNRERPRQHKPVDLTLDRFDDPYDDDGVEPADDLLWAERGLYWEGLMPTSAATSPPGRSRRPERQPLTLTGHGVRLQIHHGALVIRDGFTHYPQARREWRLFPGDRSLPSRIVVLDADGGLSFDVLAWLDCQQIPLVVLD